MIAFACLSIMGSSISFVGANSEVALAAEPEFTPVEKSATFTKGSAVKTWTVPEAVYGPIEVIISGTAGVGHMGGGAGAQFSFATERPGGESWSLLFGGQNSGTFSTLSGGQGAGLPESWGKDSDWDVTRSWGGNGGDATAIISGPATCDSEAEVLAVAAGGGGGSGQSRATTVGDLFTHWRYHGGEAGKAASSFEPGRPVSARALCEAPTAYSHGAKPQGYDLERHAGGGGGGGGFNAGAGGGPDYIEPDQVLWADYASAGGGYGGSSFLSSSVCGDCATRTVTPNNGPARIELRWREKHPAVIGVNGNNPMEVTVRSALNGQPMPGRVSLQNSDGMVAVQPTEGRGVWRLDALAHLDVLRDRVNRVVFEPTDPGAFSGHLDLVIDESKVESLVTVTAQREPQGTYLVQVQLNALAGDSNVPHLGEIIDFYAQPINTDEDFVAALPLTATPATLPSSASCMTVRLDAPPGTALSAWFRGNAFLTPSDAAITLDADTPLHPLTHDCGTPVELFVDGPGELPPPPPSDGGLPELPIGWEGDEYTYTVPPSGFKPGERHYVYIEHPYNEPDQVRGYVVDYYFDRNWAGFAKYDHTHQGWGIQLASLPSGTHEIMAVMSDPTRSGFGTRRSNHIIEPITVTVAADTTTVSIGATPQRDTESSNATTSADVRTTWDGTELLLGEPVSLRATVAGRGAADVPDGGLVAFYDDDLLLGHAGTLDGSAALDGVILDGATNQVRAEYLGVQGVLESSTSTVSIDYEDQPVTLTMDTPDLVVAESTETLRVTASTGTDSPLGAPRGTLVLRSDESPEEYAFTDATATVTDDGYSTQWVLPVADLPVGFHSLSAVFQPDAGFTSARTDTATVRVEPRGTVLQVGSGTFEGQLRFDIAATISPEGLASDYAATPPTGVIRVYSGDTVIASAIIVRGAGTIDVPHGDFYRFEFDPAHEDLSSASMSIDDEPPAESRPRDLAVTGVDANHLMGATIAGCLVALLGTLIAARRFLFQKPVENGRYL